MVSLYGIYGPLLCARYFARFWGCSVEEDRTPAPVNLNFSGEITFTLTMDMRTNTVNSDSGEHQEDATW